MNSNVGWSLPSFWVGCISRTVKSAMLFGLRVAIAYGIISGLDDRAAFGDGAAFTVPDAQVDWCRANVAARTGQSLLPGTASAGACSAVATTLTSSMINRGWTTTTNYVLRCYTSSTTTAANNCANLNNAQTLGLDQQYACPANSSHTSQDACTCNGGYSPVESGGVYSCEPNAASTPIEQLDGPGDGSRQFVVACVPTGVGESPAAPCLTSTGSFKPQIVETFALDFDYTPGESEGSGYNTPDYAAMAQWFLWGLGAIFSFWAIGWAAGRFIAIARRAGSS